MKFMPTQTSYRGARIWLETEDEWLAGQFGQRARFNAAQIDLDKLGPTPQPVEVEIPNALTRETLDKAERGEDVTDVATVEELFEGSETERHEQGN